ncbi:MULTISPECIES: STM4015 family protein [Nocardiopsidaceae]|uniref:STM4015 family protein n=1 Tax=Streptomonospora nanhaiensis TaxID=1323731 RepID=A0ABY6YPR1_9ACTN|nr:STM4015 family protein [Streptomonospora nanhaiensis]WAE74236.1 STM4015 family protein [Streptomonospora nanhaiensis]
MPNRSHLTEFAGLPVVEFTGWDALRDDFGLAMYWARNRREPHTEHPKNYERLFEAIADPGSAAWRLRMETPSYGTGSNGPIDTLGQYLGRFAEIVAPAEVTALIVGYMGGDYEAMPPDEVRDRLLDIAPKLTALRSLFFGEIRQQENEISWIEHGDLSPLLAAFPDLAEFTVRGGSAGLGLALGEHRALRSLTVQSGALRPEVVRDVCASPLPGLERLELWPGSKEYGGESTPEDLAPVLSGEAFPRLRHLGLRNAEELDDWIPALAGAPVLSSLDTLDLSLGTLTDEGARALLGAPAFRGLKRLDLHHHYMSEETAARVRAEFAGAGVEVDVSDPREPDVGEYGGETHVHRYSAVSE